MPRRIKTAEDENRELRNALALLFGYTQAKDPDFHTSDPYYYVVDILFADSRAALSKRTLNVRLDESTDPV